MGKTTKKEKQEFSQSDDILEVVEYQKEEMEKEEERLKAQEQGEEQEEKQEEEQEEKQVVLFADEMADDEESILCRGALSNTIYMRTSSLLPMGEVNKDSAIVVGVGGIGRQVALQLTSLGVENIAIWDDDIVSATNVATQGYPIGDIGQHKVDSLDFSMNEIIDGNFNPYPYKFPPSDKFEDYWSNDPQIGVVFLCVDRIDIRESIWKDMQFGSGVNPAKYPLVIDGRMAAETGRVITVNTRSKEDLKYYEATLFPQEEQTPMPCTAKATIYCGNFIAAIMVAQYTRYLRASAEEKAKGNDEYRDLMFSLRSFEIFPYDEMANTEDKAKEAHTVPLHTRTNPTGLVKIASSTGTKKKKGGGKKNKATKTTKKQ